MVYDFIRRGFHQANLKAKRGTYINYFVLFLLEKNNLLDLPAYTSLYNYVSLQ